MVRGGCERAVGTVKDRPILKGYLCVLFSILVWAGWMVLSRMSVKGTLTAADITALRFGVSGILLLPLAFKRRLGLGPWGLKGGLVMALLIGAPYTNIAIAGMKFAPVSHASTIINGSLLVLTTAVGIRYLKEPTSPSHLFGVGLSLCGIICMLAATSNGTRSEWIGHMLFIVSGLMWGGSVLLARAWRAPPVQVAISVCIFSMLFYLPYYFLVEGCHINAGNWREAAFQGAYQGVLNSIFAFIAFNMSIQLLGASRVGSLTPLVPAISTILAIFPPLHEMPSPLEWAGVATVTFGVFLASGTFKFGRKDAPKKASGEACVIAEGN